MKSIGFGLLSEFGFVRLVDYQLSEFGFVGLMDNWILLEKIIGNSKIHSPKIQYGATFRNPNLDTVAQTNFCTSTQKDCNFQSLFKIILNKYLILFVISLNSP